MVILHRSEAERRTALLDYQKYSNEELQTFASLPESKKLMQILQNDGGKALNAAIQHLQSGSVEKAMELLCPMMQSNQSQDLIRQIQKKIG